MLDENRLTVAGKDQFLGAMTYPSAIVALAGARDNYQVPLALHEENLLHTLITDLYWPADRKWFAASVGRVLPESLIAKRYCPGLSSSKVQISGSALSAFTLMKAANTLSLNWFKGKTLSKRAKRLALDKEAALFCYSTYASEAFKGDGMLFPYRFLFQLHPDPRTVRQILLAEAERTPVAKSSLMAEWELALPESDYQALCMEPQLANGWVVASSYTARTLSQHGIPFERIHVVPYGVNTERFTKRKLPPSTEKPFKVIFVGSMVQRKGLSYLLDALRMLKMRNVQLTLCGRGGIDRGLLDHYSDLNVEVKIGLPHEQLVNELHESDVFVLPSLAEGFAHVILEAMSCGLPVITTNHTCAPDVIEEGVHGFTVPIRSPEAIAEKLSWGIEHRDDLAAMGDCAGSQARLFTWARFRKGVREAYKKMVDSVNSDDEAVAQQRHASL